MKENESNKYPNGLMFYPIYYYQILFCVLLYLISPFDVREQMGKNNRRPEGWLVKVSESL